LYLAVTPFSSINAMACSSPACSKKKVGIVATIFQAMSPPPPKLRTPRFKPWWETSEALQEDKVSTMGLFQIA
jgi:hypothetical protein